MDLKLRARFRVRSPAHPSCLILSMRRPRSKEKPKKLAWWGSYQSRNSIASFQPSRKRTPLNNILVSLRAFALNTDPSRRFPASPAEVECTKCDHLQSARERLSGRPLHLTLVEFAPSSCLLAAQ